MYPSLRIDHLRYLEKCGLVKPAITENERFFGFADLTALRQIAGELQQGATFGQWYARCNHRERAS
jgi:DNA-binding transcriptional MerR regulator